MSDAMESLKRVLMNVKKEARGMRKGNLEARYAPKPKAKEPEEEMKPLEIPEEEPAAEAADEKAKEKESIQRLLRRA